MIIPKPKQYQPAKLNMGDGGQTYVLTACQIFERDEDGYPTVVRIIAPRDLLAGRKDVENPLNYDPKEAEHLLVWVPEIMVPPFKSA